MKLLANGNYRCPKCKTEVPADLALTMTRSQRGRACPPCERAVVARNRRGVVANFLPPYKPSPEARRRLQELADLRSFEI